MKPLLKMHNGKTDSERIRTRNRAVDRVVQLVMDLGELEQALIAGKVTTGTSITQYPYVKERTVSST